MTHPRHFPGRPTVVPYTPPPVEPDDLRDAVAGPRGIANGFLLGSLFWLVVGVVWWTAPMIGVLFLLAIAGTGLWALLRKDKPYRLPYDKWWRNYDHE